MLLARSNGEANSALPGFEEKLREKLFSLNCLSWCDGMMPGKEWKFCSSLGHDLLHLSPKKNAIYYWTQVVQVYKFSFYGQILLRILSKMSSRCYDWNFESVMFVAGL